jgi:acetyltransferase-like isoleucine patch superfamily enzyme
MTRQKHPSRASALLSRELRLRLPQLTRGAIRGHIGARFKSGVRVWKKDAVVRIGSGALVGQGVRIAVFGDRHQPAELRVGAHTSIGDRSIINVQRCVTIGESCDISWDVQILDSDFHTIAELDGSLKDETAAVAIADHVWIGTGVIILKGVSIGKDSVIGAGAVVSTNVPDGVLVAGNPARVIRKIDGWR